MDGQQHEKVRRATALFGPLFIQLFYLRNA